MEKYNYNNLSQSVGDKMKLKDDEGNEAELTIAEVIKGALDGNEWESFTVIYTGEKDVSVPQGTYTFSHEKIGVISLFISPNSATEYETIITRRYEIT